jgi:hypothetical protein
MLLRVKILFIFLTFFNGVNSSRVYYSYENSTFIKKIAEVGANNLIRHKSPQEYVTHSQTGQDTFVLVLLNKTTNGYYIDLAANDWKSKSNTNSLEVYYNWTGICIEPNPEYLNGLSANRSCSVVTNPISSRNNDVVRFHMDKGAGEYGGIVSKEQVSSYIYIYIYTYICIYIYMYVYIFICIVCMYI